MNGNEGREGRRDRSTCRVVGKSFH